MKITRFKTKTTHSITAIRDETHLQNQLNFSYHLSTVSVQLFLIVWPLKVSRWHKIDREATIDSNNHGERYRSFNQVCSGFRPSKPYGIHYATKDLRQPVLEGRMLFALRLTELPEELREKYYPQES